MSNSIGGISFKPQSNQGASSISKLVEAKNNPTENTTARENHPTAYLEKQGLNFGDLHKVTLNATVNAQKPKKATDAQTAAQANQIAIRNGFDPLISKEALSSGNPQTAREEIRSSVSTYYNKQIENVRNDNSIPRAAKQETIRELEQKRDQELTKVTDKFDKEHRAAYREANREMRGFPEEDKQAYALSKVTANWNERIRTEALQKAAGEYENMSVVDKNGNSVSFKVPYNWNVGSEANGFKLGKGTAEEIKTKVQGLIDNGSIKDTSPEGIAKYCRENKIGIDCSGFAYNVRDRADKLLGGNGVVDTAPKGVLNTSSSEFNSVNVGTKVSLDNVRPGDTLRFGENGHHIAIVTGVYTDKDGNKHVQISHSNEKTALSAEDKTPWGVRSGELVINKDGTQKWNVELLDPSDFHSTWRMNENVGNENFA